MPKLVLPSAIYKNSFCKEKSSNTDVDNQEWHDFQVNKFDEYLLYIQKLARGKNLGKAIQQNRYWLVDGLQFLGEIHIRHYLQARFPTIFIMKLRTIIETKGMVN